jgi:hypothetical protein
MTELEDVKWQTFVFKYNLDTEATNLGDLQNLYDEGWELEMASDEVVHKGVVRIFMHLVMSKYRND